VEEHYSLLQGRKINAAHAEKGVVDNLKDRGGGGGGDREVEGAKEG